MSGHQDCGCQEYMELSRRQFIAGTGAAAAALSVPAWLPKVAFAQSFSSTRDVMVSIFLRGAADGLTICVPHGEQAYYDARPNFLAVPRPDSGDENRAIDLDGFFGFPQPLGVLMDAYNDGDLLVVHASGLPDPSRSHFDKQRWMEVGKPRDTTLTGGWLGRHLASVPPKDPEALVRGIGVGFGLQKTLQGGPNTLPVPDMGDYGLRGNPETEQERQDWIAAAYANAEQQLRDAANNAIATIGLLESIDFANYQPSGGATYPNTPFGFSMKSTAALLKADVGVEAIHMDKGGWDTHNNQGVFDGAMFNLMTDLAGAISAFHTDMFTDDRSDFTLVCMSEFGRVVQENGSQGCDHGHGNAMLVLGGSIAGGRVLTEWPGLEPEQRFQGRDLQVTIDYRDILAEIVQNRLDNPNLDIVFPDYTPTFRGVTM